MGCSTMGCELWSRKIKIMVDAIFHYVFDLSRDLKKHKKNKKLMIIILMMTQQLLLLILLLLLLL